MYGIKQLRRSVNEPFGYGNTVFESNVPNCTEKRHKQYYIIVMTEYQVIIIT